MTYGSLYMYFIIYYISCNISKQLILDCRVYKNLPIYNHAYIHTYTLVFEMNPNRSELI